MIEVVDGGDDYDDGVGQEDGLEGDDDNVDNDYKDVNNDDNGDYGVGVVGDSGDNFNVDIMLKS